ncbi:MAG: two-component system sensor histidine kinase NtrB [bacterium]
MLSSTFDDQNIQKKKRCSKSMELENQGVEKKSQEEYEELFKTIIRSRDNLQRAFDAMQSGIMVIDKNYSIRMMNFRSLCLCGESDFRKVIGKSCYQVFQKRSDPCQNCPIQYAFKTQKMPPPIECVMKQKGEDISYQLHIFPLIEAGEMKLAVICQGDFNSERRMREQHINSEKLAAMGILIGKICHEINNFLTSIIATASFVADQFEDNEISDSILREGKRIHKLVQSLTTLSRPPAGKLTHIRLQDLLDTTLSLTRNIVNSMANCRVEKEYQPNSPIILGDAHQIGQVFLNLMINAAQAMQSQQSKGVLTLGTRISPDGEYAIGFLKDNGCGIAEEDKPRIFDPFFTTKVEGTGLGLSVVKDIVEKHHGLIEFHSTINQGTTFEIFLPLAE